MSSSGDGNGSDGRRRSLTRLGRFDFSLDQSLAQLGGDAGRDGDGGSGSRRDGSVADELALGITAPEIGVNDAKASAKNQNTADWVSLKRNRIFARIALPAAVALVVAAVALSRVLSSVAAICLMAAIFCAVWGLSRWKGG